MWTYKCCDKMINYKLLLFYIVSLSDIINKVYAQENCVPANGGTGECVDIYKCPRLLTLLNKRNRSQQDYETLRKSHCGFQNRTPLVCCEVSPPVTSPPTTTPKATQPPPAATEVTPAGNRCFTPDGQVGNCVGIYSCPHITKLLQAPSPADVTFVQNSRCTGSGQYSVCCGPPPSTNNVVRPTVCALTAEPPDPATDCCGQESSGGNRIFGGNATAIDQYPWLVIIEYKKDDKIKLLCGGVLISGRYALTAGHCVAGPVLEVGRPVNVRLGEYDTSNSGQDCVEVEGGGEDCTDGALIVPIEKVIPHPQYDPNNALRRHDIAVLRLGQLIPYGDFIRPICLPSSDIAQGALPDLRLFAAGWGAVSSTQGSSNIKLHVSVPYKSQEQCQSSYNHPRRRVALWQGQLCAGGETGKDSCKGDSGGPLMYENGRLFEVVGIVSFGPTPCGLENIPGVYTKVHEYVPWIRSQITP